MCFSASASFAAGTIITGIGVATVRKSSDPKERLFSLIPVIFGFQQFAEGVVWLALGNAGFEDLTMPASRIFHVIADVVWPVLLPLSVFLMEPVSGRKRTLGFFVGGGIILSCYYLFCMFAFNMHPIIDRFHIDYVTDFPQRLRNPAFVLYLLVTVTPLFISSVRRMYIMGVVIFTSCLVTGIFYTQYLTSVWCFFAAISSGAVYLIVSDSRKYVQDSLIS